MKYRALFLAALLVAGCDSSAFVSGVQWAFTATPRPGSGATGAASPSPFLASLPPASPLPSGSALTSPSPTPSGAGVVTDLVTSPGPSTFANPNTCTLLRNDYWTHVTYLTADYDARLEDLRRQYLAGREFDGGFQAAYNDLELQKARAVRVAVDLYLSVCPTDTQVTEENPLPPAGFVPEPTPTPVPTPTPLPTETPEE